jgi:hypothetical protein
MKRLSFFLILLQYVSCQSISKKNNMNQLKISKEIFGKTKENTTIHKFILTNKNGMEVSVINFGGIITSLKSTEVSLIFSGKNCLCSLQEIRRSNKIILVNGLFIIN